MDASKFAERLAELISENETTAKELGEKKGKTKPSIASIVSIAKEIDCTIDYLLGRES